MRSFGDTASDGSISFFEQEMRKGCGRIISRKKGRFMLQLEKVKQALKAVDELCGHCETCSPDCPVAIARRALQGLNYDLESIQEEQ